MRTHGPGPNDYNFVHPTTAEAAEGKKAVLMPGLGADEPSEKARLEAENAAEEYRKKQVAIANAEAAVRDEAIQLERRAAEQARLEEERAAEYDRRMAELDAREQALADKEKAKDAQ